MKARLPQTRSRDKRFQKEADRKSSRERQIVLRNRQSRRLKRKDRIRVSKGPQARYRRRDHEKEAAGRAVWRLFQRISRIPAIGLWGIDPFTARPVRGRAGGHYPRREMAVVPRTAGSNSHGYLVAGWLMHAGGPIPRFVGRGYWNSGRTACVNPIWMGCFRCCTAEMGRMAPYRD